MASPSSHSLLPLLLPLLFCVALLSFNGMDPNFIHAMIHFCVFFLGFLLVQFWVRLDDWICSIRLAVSGKKSADVTELQIGVKVYTAFCLIKISSFIVPESTCLYFVFFLKKWTLLLCSISRRLVMLRLTRVTPSKYTIG